MDNFLHDLRYALRGILRKPGFAVTAVLTLALGIGGNTAMFSFIDTFLLQPLSYKQPEQLMLLEETNLQQDVGGSNVSFPNLSDWKARTQSFADIAGVAPATLNLSGIDEAERLSGGMITPNYFHVLGIETLAGRAFAEDEVQQGNDRVTILSEGLWKRRFGADPKIVGQTIRLNAQPYTVVGIAPKDTLRPRIDLWVPLSITPAVQRRSNHFITTIGRLKSGTELIEAEADLNRVAEVLESEYPDTNKGWRAALTPLNDEAVGDIRSGLLILMGAVGFVLLIACANFSNLLLGRANNRHHEIAIRAALGSGRVRLIRQILTESVLLSVLGGAAGIVFGFWAMSLMRTNLTESFPRMADAALDVRVLAFTFALSLLTGIVSGIMPALHGSKVDVQQSLRGSRLTSRGSHHSQNVLSVAEISVSMVLLIGAALLLTNFLRLSRLDLGFNPDDVVTFRLTVPPQKYPRGPASADFFRQTLERLRAIPGVTSAGALSHAPLSGQNLARGYMREGDPVPERSDALIASYAMMTPGLIPSLGLRLREGRDFADADSSAMPIAIINRTLAERLWPGESAVGRQIRVFTDETFPRTVVGVVDDIKQRSMIRTSPHVFVPHAQDPINTMTVMLRTSRDPSAVALAARAILATIDKDIPAYDILTMRQKIRAFSAPTRSATTMIGIFAALAVVLAMTGIYGVIAFFVSQRTQEIGVRVALGARRADILRMVLGRGFVLSAIGVGLGILGSLALTRVMADMLAGVSPTEPRIFAGMAAVLVVVTLLATLVPAWRASKIDPMAALKSE
jgi:putative ABC transport system permease protein